MLDHHACMSHYHVTINYAFVQYTRVSIYIVDIILGSAIRQWTMWIVAEDIYLMHEVDKAEIPSSCVR